MSAPLPPEKAQRILDSLVMAAQGFGGVSLRQRWSEAFEALTGAQPSPSMLAESDL